MEFGYFAGVGGTEEPLVVPGAALFFPGGTALIGTSLAEVFEAAAPAVFVDDALDSPWGFDGLALRLEGVGGFGG